MRNRLQIIILTVMATLFVNTINNSQSIELPDFVITGVQSVSIPTMKKNKSEYVPVISDEFLTPNYDAEDFTLTDYSTPIKKDLELYEEPHGYNGLLKLGIGNQTLPIGDLYLAKSIKQFLFDAHIWGSNITEYVPNAGYNTSGGKVNFNYFINKRNLPFHGLVIGVDATFLRESYKLFGSIAPTTERENNFSKFNLTLLNRLKKKLNYGFTIKGNNVNLTKDNVKENRNDWNLFIKYDFGAFAARVEGFAANQDVVKNEGVLNKYYYYGTNGYIEFNSSSLFYLKAGVHYSQQSSYKQFSPLADISFFLSKNISIFASYSGGSEFLSVNNFIILNRYYKAAEIDNVFQRTSSKITGAIKYEYEKSLELNGGIVFSKLNNYLYFEDNLVDGNFDVNTIDNVNRSAIFANLNLNTFLFGKLFANIELQNVKNSDGQRIPYTPSFTANFAYTYRFTKNILGKVGFSYFDGSYADIANSVKMPSYFDLSLYARYSLMKNLALTATLENMFNKYNYFYKNYREKPFDIIFGVEYNW